jgi:hypothetical protein
VSAQPPGRPRSSRTAIAVSLAALVVVVLGFSWVAVKSFEFIHGNGVIGGAKLKPVKVTGSQELVFVWKRDACEPRDNPDDPAHAYRDARGDVHLIASHYVTRQSVGPDLNHVEHRCPVVMRSSYDPDPARYQDKEWLFAPYSPDGTNVFALIHEEYHGNEFGNRCPSGVFERCWYNAVTLARSTDGGATFQHARPAPDHLVAEVPYRYVPDAGTYGVFQPSNIVQRKGYYYALVSTRRYRLQEYGTCLMRTNRLADPTSWRAWDGDGFNVQFVDPYRTSGKPGDHVCEPVSPNQIGDMTGSLTFNTYFDKYIVVGNAGITSSSRRRVVNGFFYSLSDDLIHWSERKLIKEVVLPQTYRCGDQDPVLYASLLDPKSKSRNFETTGRRPYLYFTRFHYKACQQTDDRDLARVPIEFSK